MHSVKLGEDSRKVKQWMCQASETVEKFLICVICSINMIFPHKSFTGGIGRFLKQSKWGNF